MKNLSLVICLLTLASCSNSGQKKETIKVVGEGKVSVKPDQVILTIDISFTQPRMIDAVRIAQLTSDSVVNILKAYSKDDTNIKTGSVSANKHYQWNGKQNVFDGFNATVSINFVLSDISKFTALTGKLLETRINSIKQVQFTHSKADSLLREADLLAYDDALNSAQKLCNRAHRNLGRLLFMSNYRASDFDNSGFPVLELNTYNKGFGGDGFKISPEVLEFKRSVVSEYEIH